MDINIKNILIFLIVFLLVMWLQHNDDNKLEIIKKRDSLYDKVKLPLVTSVLVLLIKDIDYKECMNMYNSLVHNTVGNNMSTNNQMSTNNNISTNNEFLNDTPAFQTPTPAFLTPTLQTPTNEYSKVLNDIYIEPPNF